MVVEVEVTESVHELQTSSNNPFGRETIRIECLDYLSSDSYTIIYYCNRHRYAYVFW